MYHSVVPCYYDYSFLYLFIRIVNNTNNNVERSQIYLYMRARYKWKCTHCSKWAPRSSFQFYPVLNGYFYVCVCCTFALLAQTHLFICAYRLKYWNMRVFYSIDVGVSCIFFVSFSFLLVCRYFGGAHLYKLKTWLQLTKRKRERNRVRIQMWRDRERVR